MQQQTHDFLTAAIDLMQKDQFEPAIGLLDKVKRNEPVLRELEYLRSLCFIKLNDVIQAQRSLEAELANFPDNQEAKRIYDQLFSEAVTAEVDPSIKLERGAGIFNSTAAKLNHWFSDAAKLNPIGALDLISLADQVDSGLVDFLIDPLLNPHKFPQTDLKKYSTKLRAVLVNNPKLFTEIYKRSVQLSGGRNSAYYQASGAEETQVGAIAKELANESISVWKGMYSDPEFLASCNEVIERSFDKGRAELNGSGQLSKIIQTSEIGCDYDFHLRPESGRTRGFFHKGQVPAHPFLRKPVLDARMPEVISRAYNCNADLYYMMTERLDVADVGDYWHIDSIRDYAKVMILLTDTEEEHGAMRFKPGTKHCFCDNSPLIHNIFCYGLDQAYPSEGVVRSLGGETTFATGKAGDAVFFDTAAVHSGMPCLKDHRMGIVLRFELDTVKNRIINHLRCKLFI